MFFCALLIVCLQAAVLHGYPADGFGNLYVGCYVDKNHRYLPERADDVDGVGQCIALCRQKEYRYAGLQFGKQCFCGNQHDKSPMSDKCTMPCNIKHQTCGGVWANSIYRTGILGHGIGHPGLGIGIPGDVMDSRYMGCYSDETHRYLPKKMKDVSGVNQCIRMCYQSEYKYAGLQYGKQCFCGNVYDLSPRSNKCTMLCENRHQTCGGEWANSIYRTGYSGLGGVYPGHGVAYPGPGVVYPEHVLGYPGHGLAYPDHGLDYPGHGLDYPGPGLAYPEHVLGYPGVGLPYPDHGLDYPGHGLDYPGHGLGYPGLGGAYPGLGGAYPGLGGAYPGLGGAYPGLGGGYPGLGGGYPGLGGGYPGLGGDYPGIGGDHRYIGCYQDYSQQLSKFASNVRSAAQCILRCNRQGYMYAGLKNGRQCYCGHGFSKSHRTHGCNIPCQTSGEMCGGVWAYSIYQTDDDYIGCFKDKKSRVLPVKVGEVRYIRECKRKCYNYLFAGVQFGKECYCGNRINLYEKVESCSMKCKSGERNCGGVWANSIYRSLDRNSAPRPLRSKYYMNHIGCYKDTSDRMLSHKADDVEGVLECIENCRNKRYIYAGVQYGKQCFCGNTYQHSSSVNKCNMMCKNGDEGCGGEWANSIYVTTHLYPNYLYGGYGSSY